MGYFREPETATLIAGYVLIGLSVPTLIVAGASAVLSTFARWSVFGLLADEHRALASLLCAVITGAAVMALTLGVRAISDKHVEGEAPISAARPVISLGSHVVRSAR